MLHWIDITEGGNERRGATFAAYAHGAGAANSLSRVNAILPRSGRNTMTAPDADSSITKYRGGFLGRAEDGDQRVPDTRTLVTTRADNDFLAWHEGQTTDVKKGCCDR